MDERRGEQGARRFLAMAVLGHLAVTFVHGAVHAAANVPMTMAANVFIYLVIEAGPLAGWWLARSRPRAGGWLVAATMAGSLVFGIANHFVIASPDHVNHVAAEWRMLFASTAVLLVITEGIGVAAGAWFATRAPAATPSRGQENPRRGVGVSSRRGWGPGANAIKKGPL
jgi:hypothetical protein